MICCLLSTALRTGFVLCIAGLSTVSIVLLLVPLVADQACDLQPMATQKPPNVLNLQGDGDCEEVVIAGFLTILSVPGTLLLLVGFFIVIMAGGKKNFFKKIF